MTDASPQPPAASATAQVLARLLAEVEEGELSGTPAQRHWLAGATAALDVGAAQGEGQAAASPTSASAL